MSAELCSQHALLLSHVCAQQTCATIFCPTCFAQHAQKTRHSLAVRLTQPAVAFFLGGAFLWLLWPAIALAGVQPAGARQAVAALVFYLGTYLFMNLAAFAIVAVLILAIACINYINMSTADATRLRCIGALHTYLEKKACESEPALEGQARGAGPGAACRSANGKDAGVRYRD